MGSERWPWRQVHLDFHTSEHIPGVGARWEKGRWQEALRVGRVQAINIFAKCHHGWSYYPTRVGVRHPKLKLDLLGKEIEASHEIGVRTPIYYTVGWSAREALAHPEWRVIKKDGSVQVLNYDLAAKPTDRKPYSSWVFLCPSGAYAETILAQTREICERYPVDGFWYDICCGFGVPCYCPNCRKGMKRAGLDPANDADAMTWHRQHWQGFMQSCNDVVRQRHPDSTVFYNGAAQVYGPEWWAYVTQLEMEDLPTTWGGYDKLPLRARALGETGKPLVAMSGKFHTTWGEFGGFKAPEAIRFEAACHLAYGSRSCFGDQLHPDGEMDLETYRNIGEAYAYIEEMEEFGRDGVPAANLGLMLSGPHDGHDQGVVNMLLETATDFRVVTDRSDLAQFDAVVLTGDVRVDRDQARRLNAYVEAGGGLLLLGRSGLDRAGKRFGVEVGAKYVSTRRYDYDYIVGRELGRGMVESPVLADVAGERARVTDGKALSAIREPYFDRTYARYCSHRNTPYRLTEAPHPGAVELTRGKGRAVWVAHALGQLYHLMGARQHRQYFVNALARVYRRPNVEVTLPSAGRATFIKQADRRRYVVHLLYGPPMSRGKCLVIEDLVPVRDVAVRVRVPERIRRAFVAPGMKTLELTRRGGSVSVRVDEVCGHAAVVLEY